MSKLVVYRYCVRRSRVPFSPYNELMSVIYSESHDKPCAQLLLIVLVRKLLSTW